MKKLLGLLIIFTLTASLPVPLLANAPLALEWDIDKTTAQLIRNKREGEETYELKLKKGKFLIEKNTNVKKTYDFSLKIESIPKKDVSDWTQKFITFQNQADNKYVEISKWMFFNENSNVYNNLINSNFDLKKQTTFDFNKNITLNLLKHNRSKSFMIEIVNIEIERDSTDNLEWVKQRSHFNLVDSSKTKKWTRSDLLTVDGELNIEITNLNIDKVLFDNIQQSQTNKQWNINVKPETSAKDHNLQVFFTLNGKQYTSEITVSMQAKINPPKPIIKENLDKVIKFNEENNLENILDNNNETIISAITQKNSLQVDFSQIEFAKKDIHSTTLSAKKDSKSYQGSVVVKFNVVPATIVDLKIDLQPTAPTTQIVKDYVGQIDTSIIINPVNTFYYANSESKITMLKPTPNSVISGVVYACDEQWNKTLQHNQIDPTNGIVLDGSQLATSNGKYVVELSDNLGHTNNIYLQIALKQAITKYFDTDNGKKFEQWAKANGRDDIRGYSARQLNKMFAESQNWQHQASDNQFANALADWFKTNGKLSSKEPLTKEQVIAQLKTQTPKTITIDKVDTSNYDFKKVSFELNQNEIKPNEPVNIVVEYDSEKSDSLILQIANSNPPIIINNKSGLTGWAIIGVVIGALSGLLLLGWLLKKFVVTPFILEPIRKKKVEAFQRQTEKDIAQMKADEKEEQEKNK